MLCSAKAEESAWMEVANLYNSYRDNVLSEMDKRPSASKKGKQRATSQELEDWENVREFELPEMFRGKGGVGLARRFVGAKRDVGKNPLSARLQSLEFKVSLHYLKIKQRKIANIFGDFRSIVCTLTSTPPFKLQMQPKKTWIPDSPNSIYPSHPDPTPSHLPPTPINPPSTAPVPNPQQTPKTSSAHSHA